MDNTNEMEYTSLVESRISNINSYADILKARFKAIADATRAKTKTNSLLYLEEIESRILSLVADSSRLIIKLAQRKAIEITIEELQGIESVGDYAFYNFYSIKTITLPSTITSIGNYAFYGCNRLTTIIFDGTKEQWNAISKGTYWNYFVPATYVTCSDGTVDI